MNVARNTQIQMRVMSAYADERRMSLQKEHFNRFTNILQSTTCNRILTNE